MSDEQLLGFYHLKTLNPSTSYQDDSSFIVDLSKWKEAEPDASNSYDILRDLLLRQQHTNQRENTLKDSSLLNVRDPLSDQQMLPLLEKLHIAEQDRPKYLINSKTFDVKAYLRDIHKADSFEQLSSSLDNLDKTLEGQSEELKELVQSNFTRYVRIKNRLDEIYEQFSEKSNIDASNKDDSQLDVSRLSGKVDESITATTLKLKPVLKTFKKLASYQTTKAFIEENREIFCAPRALRECLERNDYAGMMLEYSKAQALYQKLIKSFNSDEGMGGNTRVPVIARKIWEAVEQIIEEYRRHTWHLLLSPSKSQTQQTFLPLISKLLDLKVDRNPIASWIDTRLDDFEKQLANISTQSLQKLANTQKTILESSTDSEDDSAAVNGVDLTFYLSINQFLPEASLRSGEKSGISAFQGLTDSPILIEGWLTYLKYVNLLENLCSKFIEFWEHVQNFMDGTYQASLLNDKKKDNILVGDLTATDGHKEFLQLEESQNREIRERGDHFINLFLQNLLLFFNSSQDSLSRRQKIQKENGSPEDFGFIPPRANGLSCLRYLPKMAEPLLKSITQLAQLGVSSKTIDSSRKLASVLINRCVGAIASTKLRDISNLYRLEDWTVYENVSDSQGNEYGITHFPEVVRLFQTYCIRTTRDLLFAFEKLPVFNGISVVSYPSKQELTAAEIQQLISMEAVLEAILKNAAKDKDNPRNPHTILTLTNLQYIREVSFPDILQDFDEAFECHLKDKNLELFTLLSKMESSIFGNYLSDLKINIRDVLEIKFNEISWASYTSNSFRAGDYIIEVLMLLVTIHSECFRMGPQLINRILQESQIFISKYLFEAFKPYIGNLSSDGLLQVTVDLEFFRRVLGPQLENDTKVTLAACLQNCFQNNTERMERCIKETEPIVSANLARTSTQFAAFK